MSRPGLTTCPVTLKRRYRSKHVATAALSRVRQMQDRYGDPRRVTATYRCRHCDGFHLTSKHQFNRKQAAA